MKIVFSGGLFLLLLESYNIGTVADFSADTDTEPPKILFAITLL